MTEKEIVLEIDGFIKTNPELRNRSEFCRRTGRSIQSFNQMINAVVEEEKTMWVNNLLSILDDLDKKLIIVDK